MLVSIVVPCRNAEDFVCEAIDSALAQTYPDTEVIVIDDGSTDRSTDILASYDGKIRWETTAHRGGGAARNRGIEIARGDLIQFLDADDILFPDKVARCVDVSREQGSEFTVICDWERGWLLENDCTEPRRLGYAENSDPVLFCLRNQLPVSSPLHWKSNLEKVGGFDETLPCSQERDLHLRLACLGGRFSYLPEVLYQVRRREGSVSSDFGKVLAQHGYIFERACDLLRAEGKLNDRYARAFAEAIAKDARLCLRLGNRPDAVKYFELAARIHEEGALEAFKRPVMRYAARRFGPRFVEDLCRLALRLGVRV